MATKTYAITLDKELHETAIKNSLEWNRAMGKNKSNVSGYIGYLINKANKEL